MQNLSHYFYPDLHGNLDFRVLFDYWLQIDIHEMFIVFSCVLLILALKECNILKSFKFAYKVYQFIFM